MLKHIFRTLGHIISKLNFGNWIKWDYIFSKVFGAYDPKNDTEILLNEEKFGTKYVLVIRKSLWFSVFKGFNFLVNIFLLLLNIYLLSLQNIEVVSQHIIISILVFNVLYGVVVFVGYLLSFRHLYGKSPKVDSIYTYIQKSEKGDILYSKVFNQTVTNIFLFFVLSMYLIVSLFVSGEVKGTQILFAIINVFLLFIQIFLLIRVKTTTNNQEMDFCIITPTKFYVYDQLGYTNLEKNDFPIMKIRNVKGTYGSSVRFSSLLGSILKYGTLQFLLDGESAVGGTPEFQYTPQLDSTKQQVSLFIDDNEEHLDTNGKPYKRYKKAVEPIPFVLTYIMYKLKLDIVRDLDDVIHNGLHKEEITNYLKTHTREIRTMFETSDNDIKKEIITLGEYYLKGKES